MFIKLNLKKSEKRIIKFGVWIALCLLPLHYIVFPLTENYKQMKEAKIQYTSDLPELIKKINESKDADKKLGSQKKQIRTYEEMIIEAQSEQLGQVKLEELVTSIAKDHELEMKRSYPEKPKEAGFGYTELAARFTVKGEYEDVILMMQDIENENSLIYVSEFTIKFYRGYEATLTVKALMDIGDKK